MVYAFGAYTLDTDRYELRRAGTVCPLEPHAVDILTYFLQHPDRVVTKRELLEQLWPGRFVGEGIPRAADHDDPQGDWRQRPDAAVHRDGPWSRLSLCH